MSTKDHPVWSVYDELRTARLNVKYLQREIAVIEGWNKLQEIVAAVGGGGPGVAGIGLLCSTGKSGRGNPPDQTQRQGGQSVKLKATPFQA